MIIALTGKKRSGKDVCANYLEKNYGFSNYKFASPIKRAVADIFLWDDDWVNGEYKEVQDARWGISPREAQQVVGTEMFRELLPEMFSDFEYMIGKDVWCKRFQYWYKALPAELNVVVSDCRFLNEAEIMQSMGGKVVRVNRAGLESHDSHPSEMEMDKIIPDYTIENDASIPSLEIKIARIYKELLNGI